VVGPGSESVCGVDGVVTSLGSVLGSLVIIKM